MATEFGSPEATITARLFGPIELLGRLKASVETVAQAITTLFTF